MSQANGQSIPLFKITINREPGNDMGSCGKFIIMPENFVLSSEQGQFQNSGDYPSIAPRPTSGTQYIKCAVPFCNNYFDGMRTEFAGISHFSFPKDLALRNEWMSIVNPPSHLDLKTAKVCSAHFSESDLYSMESGCKALRPAAIPRRKLCSRRTISVTAPYDANSLSQMVNTVPSTVSWSEQRQNQSEVFPKIASVHSVTMSTVVTQIVNPSDSSIWPGNSMGRSAYDYQNSAGASPNPEQGLINIPAKIRIPPKIAVVDLVDGPSSSAAGTSTNRNASLDCGSPADDVVNQKTKRRKRSDADDSKDWLPFKERLKTSAKRDSQDRSLESIDVDHDDFYTRKTDSSEKTFKLRNVIKPDGDNPLSNSSLLVDWSFFKSLKPFLKKMNSAQRCELKTFILDSLNNMIYCENPSSLNVA